MPTEGSPRPTWQALGRHRVGALGAVALHERSYHDFCSAMFAIKRDVLGAREFEERRVGGSRKPQLRPSWDSRGRGNSCCYPEHLVRTGGDWRQRFIQVPDFTVSSVSPGLQAADMITYLGPHLSEHSERSELRPYIGRMIGLRYEYPRDRSGRVSRTIRRVG